MWELGGDGMRVRATAGSAIVNAGGAASPPEADDLEIVDSEPSSTSGTTTRRGIAAPFTELASIVITPQRLPTNVLVLVLDVSDPLDLLATASTWSEAVRSRVAECTDKLRQQVPTGANSLSSSTSRADNLARAADARLRVGWAQRTGVPVELPVVIPTTTTSTVNGRSGGSDGALKSATTHPSLLRLLTTSPAAAVSLAGSLPPHPDYTLPSDANSASASPLPLVVVVVASKWDAMGAAGWGGLPATCPPVLLSACKRSVVAALRAVAHSLGATLVGVSARDRASTAAWRATMAAAAFGTEPAAAGGGGAHISSAITATASMGAPPATSNTTATGVPRRPAVPPATVDASGGRPMYLPAGSDCWTSIGAPPYPPQSGQLSGAASTSSLSSLEQLGRVTPDARLAAFEGALQACFAAAGAHTGVLAPRVTPPSAHASASTAAVASANSAGGVDTPPPTPAQLAGGGPVVFQDEPSRHPEHRVDACRIAKAEELGR